MKIQIIAYLCVITKPNLNVYFKENTTCRISDIYLINVISQAFTKTIGGLFYTFTYNNYNKSIPWSNPFLRKISVVESVQNRDQSHMYISCGYVSTFVKTY